MQDINLQIKTENIYASIYETKLEDHDKDELWCQVSDLHDHMNDKIINIYKEHKKELEKKQEELDGKIKEANNERRIIRNIPNTFKRIAIIRQSLNVLFSEMWKIYGNQLVSKNIDVNHLAEITNILKRKYIIDTEKGNGCKFALAVIHNVDPTIIFPKNICEIYIKLNDQFHPKIVPIETTIHEIQILRNEMNNVNDQLLMSYGITIDILNTIESQLTNNKSLFN